MKKDDGKFIDDTNRRLTKLLSDFNRLSQQLSSELSHAKEENSRLESQIEEERLRRRRLERSKSFRLGFLLLSPFRLTKRLVRALVK